MAAQNRRRSSRRPTGGRPGERNFRRPERSARRRFGLVITTSSARVLQRPIESTQFTSYEYQQFLQDHQITLSMSAVGHCGDNAPAEGFFGLLKRERIHRRRYRTVADAQADVFDYIERFHNPRMQRRLEARHTAANVLSHVSANTG
jgi:transposase InsO family protein